MKIWRSGRSSENAKIVKRVSLCSAAETTGSKIQCDPSPLRRVFVDRVIHFGQNLGDQVKGRSQKTLNSLIEIPYVAHLKVHVLRFKMIVISSP